MSGSTDREILNIEEAAALLGVSIKTFNKVLHTENMPARKIGREWKFSRQALIDWVGNGRSSEFYREATSIPPESVKAATTARQPARARRTEGWQIELD